MKSLFGVRAWFRSGTPWIWLNAGAIALCLVMVVGVLGWVGQRIVRRAGVASASALLRGQQALALLVRGVRAPAERQRRPAARDGGVVRQPRTAFLEQPLAGLAHFLLGLGQQVRGDERWIGADPIANKRAGKRGRVC